MTIVEELRNSGKWGPTELSLDAAKIIEAFVDAADRGAEVNTPDLMEWIADRLVHVHGENPHIDYVLSLRERAKKLRSALSLSSQPHKGE